MRHESKAVAAYLQTFILISVTLGGSLMAYRVVSTYADTAGGPAIHVWEAGITQDSGVAVERFTVSDSGQTSFASFTIRTPGLSQSSRYCYEVNSVGGSAIKETCPGMTLDPTSVRVVADLTAGSSFVVVVIISGNGVVVPGEAYPYFVSAPGAAVAAGQMVAVSG